MSQKGMILLELSTPIEASPKMNRKIAQNPFSRITQSKEWQQSLLISTQNTQNPRGGAWLAAS
jgi:hypothetical protein